MSLTFLCLVLSLGIILLSCELFTNGIENLGKRLRLGEGVVGSIFSAVGTCLPETLIPIIAILFSDKTTSRSADIGIGAILGAPFMLSTLAFFVTGISALFFWNKRKSGINMLVNTSVLARDIKFFIIVYSISIIAAFIKSPTFKAYVAVGLIGLYIYYVLLTVSDGSKTDSHVEELILGKILNVKTDIIWIMVEVMLAIAGIIFGAEIFIENIQEISQSYKIPAFVLSLIITPIATELPEKFNSIIWISKKKDTLALGNITGAMVFQSCIPVAIGLVATPWKVDLIGLVSGVISVLSSFLVYLSLKLRNRLTPLPLIMGGFFYLIFLYVLINNFI